jgi:transcriptional regulator with XRE-family HTH domain
MDLDGHYSPIAHLGESLRIARKRRGLRIVDLAPRARCSQDTLRRLENGDPGVSLGVLARVMEAIGCTQKLASLMDPAEDAEALKAEVRGLPQRVRLPLLPVERVSPEQFWADKRARQSASHNRVGSGEISQSALFSFSDEQLQGARFKWPTRGFSALEDENDLEERPASALQR